MHPDDAIGDYRCVWSWCKRMAVAVGVVMVVGNAGCDCSDCPGATIVAVDADTGRPIADAVVVVAESIYAPREPATGRYVDRFHVWASAPGYRRRHEVVDIEVGESCSYDDDICADLTEEILLVAR